MSVLIAPGAYTEAAEKHYPQLVANLTDDSAWMELINEIDDPSRSNSPYYGPATQFLIDCFFEIAEATPELTEANLTPLARFRVADFVIHQYIGDFAVGPQGLITKAYNSSDVAATAVHRRRRNHLTNDREHVMLGASVPFDDVARVAGGAALMLDGKKIAKPEIAETISQSTGLHIIAGVHGNKTPVLTDTLGHNYLEPEHFLVDDTGLVRFTQKALEVIKSVLSPVGCPTAKIEDGSNSLFVRYWGKITHYLLDNANYPDMYHELESQRGKGRSTVVILPASQVRSVVPSPQRSSVKPNKRYTPPKKR